MFLLFRVIGGICKGNISLCTAIVADLPCPNARNRGMGVKKLFQLSTLKQSGTKCQGLPVVFQASLSGHGDSWDLLSPLSLFHFTAVTKTREPPSKERMQKLQVLGLVYFCYLFLFSGLEFTLSFLTHQRFQFTRYEPEAKAAYVNNRRRDQQL
ncbi:hypothetical protein GOODEAATRI_027835 [Goodea atripinnis]|uniref:Uncharacterized protein n=1 Tax=Goodea atripinnis TaxID=208336 RepID=A0ABV0N4V8_9TELE